VQVYGDTNPDTAEQRLGVISFNINGVSHALVSAVLSYEGAIGVRSGCFCAHTYVKSLLHVSDDESALLERQILARDRSQIPGAVRASFGLYNTTAEIDELVTMVKKIVAGDYSDQYVMDKEKGEFRPKNYHVDFEKYFKF
jgi:selenocysteine lyase/cysteine desulfurase